MFGIWDFMGLEFWTKTNLSFSISLQRVKIALTYKINDDYVKILNYIDQANIGCTHFPAHRFLVQILLLFHPTVTI